MIFTSDYIKLFLLFFNPQNQLLFSPYLQQFLFWKLCLVVYLIFTNRFFFLFQNLWTWWWDNKDTNQKQQFFTFKIFLIQERIRDKLPTKQPMFSTGRNRKRIFIQHRKLSSVQQQSLHLYIAIIVWNKM